MESCNYRRWITSMNLLSHILPYFGYTDQWHLLMTQISRATSSLWKENEKPFLMIMLKSNRRLVQLKASHYSQFEKIYNLLKYFKIEFTELQKDSCKNVYLILDLFDWTYFDLSSFNFTWRSKDSGLWHLLLLRKLLVRSIPLLLDNYTPIPPVVGGIISKKLEVYFSKIIPPIPPVQNLRFIIFEEL